MGEPAPTEEFEWPLPEWGPQPFPGFLALVQRSGLPGSGETLRFRCFVHVPSCGVTLAMPPALAADGGTVPPAPAPAVLTPINVATATGAAPTAAGVKKVVAPLAGRGWVDSEPGPTGGYRSTVALTDVTVLDVPVESVHSIAEIGERHALRIAVVSLGDQLCFGFCADPELVTDLEVMAEGVEIEAERLAAAVRP